MILKSFIRDGMSLVPVDVEIVLTPGLPVITILGQPDKIIQESCKRIQTALLSQGYHMPKAKTVMVSLSPREIKKSSLGLELAIALGILHLSGQKAIPDHIGCFYGELDMQGRVHVPKDLPLIKQAEATLLTGADVEVPSQSCWTLSELRGALEFKESVAFSREFVRPAPSYSFYPKAVASLLELVCAGEHSVVLVGGPGSGKTSTVESVASFLAAPTPSQMSDIDKSDYCFQMKNLWRPVVMPHHSTTALAMVGGGGHLQPGEIVRAHQGVLILDELLEFSTDVQSILREPMEKGVLSLSRVNGRREYACKSLMLATSNLCPCGEYVPHQINRCRCSSLQLRRYLQKLSGPFVDRFSILNFTTHWSSSRNELVCSEKILQNVQETICFRRDQRLQIETNGWLSKDEVMESVDTKADLLNMPRFESQRRELFFLRVARTIADLEKSETIKMPHLEKSLFFTYFPFEEVKKIFFG